MKIPELENLPVLDEHDPRAKDLASSERAAEIAEAVDAIRVYELLHRDEYRPLAAVRCVAEGEECIRIYFFRIDNDVAVSNPQATRRPR